MTEIIYIENGNLIKLNNLIDLTDSTYVTSATILATLKTTSGDNVAGQSWPLTLTHQNSGNYQGTLTSSLSLAGITYNLEVSINSGDASAGLFDMDIRAKRRRS